MSNVNLSQLPRIVASLISNSSLLHLRRGSSDHRITVEDLRTAMFGVDTPPLWWTGTTDGSNILPNTSNLPSDNPAAYFITIAGQEVLPSEYTASTSDDEITFTSAPDGGQQFVVRSLVSNAEKSVNVEELVMSEGDTVGNIGTFTYNVGQNEVFILRSGSLFADGFTETSSSSVTLDLPKMGNERIFIIKFG